MLPCASVWALGEEREAMIIVADHSHICWVREHYGQSAVFKNPLNSTQTLAGNGLFKIAVPTGTKVGTLDNTILVSVSLYMGQGIRKKNCS